MSRDLPSSSDTHIDSRSLIARRDELQSERDDLESATADLDAWDADNGDELASLVSACKEGEGYSSDFRHGETLIREDAFEDYARELANDLGLLKNADSWPYTCIDWEAAAEELKADYTEIEFDGATYLIRCS